MTTRLVVHLAALAVLACAAIQLWAPKADACSAPFCDPGFFLPGDGGALPANAPIGWRAPLEHIGAGPDVLPPLRLDRVEPIPAVPVPFDLEPEGERDYLIRPTSELEPGATYRLAISEGCAMGSSRFTATARADLPTELGTLVATPHAGDTVMVATLAGSCVEPIPAMGLDLFLDTDPAAEPWFDLLRFTTYVDAGTPWQGRTDPGSMGGAIDLIYTECAGAELHTSAYHGGLAAGEHDVWFEASIPGGPVVTTPSTRVVLECGDPEPVMPEPEVPASSEDGSACSAGSGRGRPLGGSWIIVPLLALALRRLR
jgi:hypothetical protein